MEVIPMKLLPAGRIAIPEGLPSKEKSLTINSGNAVNKGLKKEGGCPCTTASLRVMAFEGI
jgi:hypothetical protein